MAQQFKPSKSSITPEKQALIQLRYAQKAIEKLEAYLSGQREGAVPGWVLTKISQGATCFGGALTFVSFQESKKEEK